MEAKKPKSGYRKAVDVGFTCLLGALTALALLALAFVIVFIFIEALPLFQNVSVFDFLFGTHWMPVDYTGNTEFGIFNFIVATVFVALLALLISVFFGLGCAIFLSCMVSDRARSLLYPFIDLLAGIPSVVYGFIGLVVMVPWFRTVGVSTGTSVLAAAILLSVMLLPFLVSSFSESLVRAKRSYLEASDVLGVSRWHGIAKIVLPASWRYMLMAMVLAVGRAMGETMAVMMVIGNSNVFPALLGKGETIASVIALEMGTAVVGSEHYHALYASGLVLIIVLLAINAIISVLHSKLVTAEYRELAG